MAETKEEKHLQRLKALNDGGRFFPNTLDQQGMCHIHHAVYRGYLMCAKWLFKHGSSLFARSAEGSVPAHYAAAGGHLECLKWIYRKASKSITLTDNSGATPLYFSAQEGHLNCLVWLAKHSGTVHNEMSVDGMTAGHAAALEGHLDCLAFLLSSAGCSAQARDRAANTPLHYAAACGHRSCVEWLMANNSVCNERNKLGSTPLHVAAQNGHLEVVKLLVRAGAAIKFRDRLGRTPFNMAMESGNEACAHFLYQAETYSMESVNGLSSRNHSLKRVRFERKAIEKDSEPVAISPQSNDFTTYDRVKEREHRTRKPYSLYRNSAESGVLINHHNNLQIESDGDRSPYGSRSPMNGRYTAQLPQGFNSAFEDLHLKSHTTSSSLLPWSRVYRMTQSTESLPNPTQPQFYGSYSLSDTSGRDDVSTEPHFTGSRHYRVTSFESPSSSVKRDASFLSRFRVSRRKNKEFFPAEVDTFDDVINDTNSQDGNVFKRIYRYSKRKVTRSSSFAIGSVTNEVQLSRNNSFVVSGNDAFLTGSRSAQASEPVLHQEKGDTMPQEKGQKEFSRTDIRYVRSDSFMDHRKSADKKRTRKRVTSEAKGTSSSRENSMIW